jgi:L-aminoadipate-semialdehyde dehydrogenase
MDSQFTHTPNMQVNGVAPHLKRWAERLKDLTVPSLTRDYPEPQLEDKGRQDSKAIESLEASQDVQNALNELQSLASPFHILLTACILLVSRLTGDEDIAMGTNSEVDGRPFVLRLPIAPKESFSKLALKA